MHISEYLATLDFVNKERRRMGLPVLDHLPKGLPGHMRRCVIAKAIPGTRVDLLRISGSANRRLPRDVCSFIRHFDTGTSLDPGSLVDGGIDDDKGCLTPA